MDARDERLAHFLDLVVGNKEQVPPSPKLADRKTWIKWLLVQNAVSVSISLSLSLSLSLLEGVGL